MSRPHDPVPPDREVREIQKRIAQQKALVHRMIVQGTPTQGAEDRLRELQQTLLRMTRAHPRVHASHVQPKLRNHLSK
jgi:hypothetical protein